MKKISKKTLGLIGVLLIASNVLHAEDIGLQKKAAAPKTETASSEAPVTPMDEALITIDGQPITSRLYISFLQTHPEVMAQAASTEDGKQAALRELVSAFLLQKAMVDEGLLKKGEETPTQKQMIDAYEELASKHFPLPPTPDDSQAYPYYQSHQNEFGIPAMIRLNEILFKIPSGADKAVENAARSSAEKALDRIKTNDNFSKVATDLTENPIGKLTHGDIGFVEVDQEKWMKDAVNNLKPGEYTGILRSPKGYVVLQVSEIRPGLISPYANVRDKVIKNLRDSKQKELRDPYVRQLAKKVKLVVVSDHIKPLFPNGIFPD